MQQTKESPARKGEAYAALAGSAYATYNAVSPEEQANRLNAPVHLIGSPRVIVTTRGGSTFVTVVNRPWGWVDLDREFLSPNSPAAERYARQLRQKIIVAAFQEEARRQRLKAARKAEQDVRRRQAEGGGR